MFPQYENTLEKHYYLSLIQNMTNKSYDMLKILIKEHFYAGYPGGVKPPKYGKIRVDRFRRTGFILI